MWTYKEETANLKQNYQKKNDCVKIGAFYYMYDQDKSF